MADLGGLDAARAMRRADVRVTLVDRRNFHLFQPLLYQVATGGLSPANIAMPLRSILKRQKNVRVVLGEVVAIDPALQRVILADGLIPYDTLVVAAGARHHYFGNANFEEQAPGLKSIEDATLIRKRIMTAFETAERHPDPRVVARCMTFVIVGGGPTGVELAGAIGELALHTLRAEFRNIDTREARIFLVEGSERILRTYPESLSRRAAACLQKLGVTPRLSTLVEDITAERVSLRCGDETDAVATNNVFWTAGVQASPLGMLLARAVGVETDPAGRLIVEPDCTLSGHQNVYVVGDLAHYAHGHGQPLPGLGAVAMQQGAFVADCIGRKLQDKPARQFRYKDRGQMATVGKAAAVVNLGRIQFGGWLAWLFWLLVHLLLLVGFENRALVLMQWCWNYCTRNRSARLITHGDAVLIHRDDGLREEHEDRFASTTGFEMRG